jgi:hypothetical protein
MNTYGIFFLQSVFVYHRKYLITVVNEALTQEGFFLLIYTDSDIFLMKFFLTILPSLIIGNCSVSYKKITAVTIIYSCNYNINI